MFWRRLFYLVGAFCVSILFLEILLQVFDPWGAVRYFTSGGPSLDSYILLGERPVLPAGEYRFSNWSAQINPDHSRFVPDNGNGACTIAFVGDSVTFGLGVDDADTWVNLLAGNHPDWNTLNLGVAGYNSAAVRLSIAASPADAYVYLISNNDAEAQIFHPSPEARPIYQSALAIYLRVWQIHQRGYENPAEMRFFGRRFDWDIRALSSHANLLIFGFENDELAQSAQNIDSSVILLPPYTAPISVADPHPNEAGHRQIATALEPYLRAAIPSFCPLER